MAKSSANAFIATAEKSKREMASIQNGGSHAKETKKDAEKKISIIIPAELHKAAQIHRVETGESMTRLIIRLLTEELG